jgi:hypothetical protein
MFALKGASGKLCSFAAGDAGADAAAICACKLLPDKPQTMAKLSASVVLHRRRRLGLREGKQGLPSGRAQANILSSIIQVFGLSVPVAESQFSIPNADKKKTLVHAKRRTSFCEFFPKETVRWRYR